MLEPGRWLWPSYSPSPEVIGFGEDGCGEVWRKEGLSVTQSLEGSRWARLEEWVLARVPQCEEMVPLKGLLMGDYYVFTPLGSHGLGPWMTVALSLHSAPGLGAGQHWACPGHTRGSDSGFPSMEAPCSPGTGTLWDSTSCPAGLPCLPQSCLATILSCYRKLW